MTDKLPARLPGLSFILLLMSCVIGVNTVFAQSTDAVSNESSAIKITTLEQAYDSQIYSVLSGYFDRRTFFVDVTIDAEVVQEMIQSTSNKMVRERNQNIMMPGLPFLPEENIREGSGGIVETPETVVSENVLRSLQLNSVRINIYADTSYNEMDLEFMRFIAGMAAKVNEERGDIININRLPIPKITGAAPTGPQITVVNQPPAQTQGFFNNLQQLIPGLILMLLLGLTVFFSRYSKKSDDKESGINPREFREAVKSMEDYSSPIYSGSSGGSPVPADKPQIDTSGASGYEGLVNAFFDRPDEIAGIFEYWISSEGWEGAVKSAEVVAVADPQLIRTLKSHLSDEQHQMVKEMLNELGSISLEKRQDVVKNFGELLNSGAQRNFNSKRSGNVTLFKFLDHIPDDLLMVLLRSEEPETSALLLSKMPDDKAAALLDKLGKDRAAKIILKMTSIHKLSQDDQSNIASVVFDNAMDLVEKQKEQQTKVENILPILEKLPVNAQRDFIDELKETEPYIGARIEEEFVTIEEIPQINKRLIENAIKPLSTEVLLDALAGLDERIVNAILTVRPKREQKLLRLELEQLEDHEISNTDSAKARLMSVIRVAVKQYRNE
jgi:flagellar motor switch protein FliG